MEYGLLGEKLGHSFSPKIHRALAGYDYRLLPTPPEEVEPLFRERKFKGLNVTIPYKQSVMPLCDEIDPRAAAIGAVNTVVNRDGRLTGYNTDIDGLIYMARRAGVELSGKKVVILGSGGTSRTAQAAAQELGAAEIVTVSRKGADNYENLSRHKDAQVIVNTTPVGMFPRCGEAPVSLALFPCLTGVLDVVYNPLRTALLMEAEQRGLPCSCGLPMLVAQAKESAGLCTGASIPDSRTEEVLQELTAQLRNIVLIGMPGCGKSSVGQVLAGRLGKQFADLDQLIEEEARKPIPRIFSEDGEEAFRRLESDWRGHGPCPQRRRRSRHPPGELRPPASEWRDRPYPAGPVPAAHSGTACIPEYGFAGAVAEEGTAVCRLCGLDCGQRRDHCGRGR